MEENAFLKSVRAKKVKEKKETVAGRGDLAVDTAPAAIEWF
jgi:hypothetical protein